MIKLYNYLARQYTKHICLWLMSGEVNQHFETELLPEPIEELSYGSIYREIIKVNGGDEYEVRIGQPNNALTDFPVVGTTAFTTSLDGHNNGSMKRLMRAGNNVIMIGPEGGHAMPERSFIEHVDRAASIRIHRTSRALHHILKSKQISKYELDTDKIFMIGESRGAMVALAAVAWANQYDCEVLYFDLLAPAMPEDPTLRQLGKYILQIPKEILAAIFESVVVEPDNELSRKQRLNELAGTVQHPKSAIFYLVASIPALVWARIGLYVDMIDSRAAGNITVFSKDSWSHPDKWPDSFRHHPSINVNTLEGPHLKLIRPAVSNDVCNRITSLQSAIALNPEISPSEVITEKFKRSTKAFTDSRVVELKAKRNT